MTPSFSDDWLTDKWRISNQHFMPILNMGELSIKIPKSRVLTHGFQKLNNIGCSLSWKKKKYRLECLRDINRQVVVGKKGRKQAFCHTIAVTHVYDEQAFSSTGGFRC